MAEVDALSEKGVTGGGRLPVSRQRVRRAARLALAQMEDALGAGDSKRAKELSGVLREMLQLYRELLGSTGQSVTVCFVGDSEEAAG